MSVRAATLTLALAAAALAGCPAEAKPPASRGRSADPFGVAGPQSMDQARRIDINRINMWTTNFGSSAFDLSSTSAGFVYPRGSGKTAIFASGIWLGCTVGGTRRTVVAEYTQEYGPGRMLGGTIDEPLRPEYITYKVARYTGDPADTAHVDRTPAELALDPSLDPLLHHSWSEYVNGAAPHGGPTRVYRLPNTATPAPGDSVDVVGPAVTGDQMLWSVFNDADPALHTNDAGLSPPLGVEIRQKTFGFDRADPLGRTVFIEYTIVNKGGNLLENAFISLWSDPDVGGFTDDLVGFDSTRAMGYAYNGASVDPIYGSSPPAVGYLLLRGPAIVPGLVYMGPRSFNAYINGTDPASTTETYNYMQGLLPDGSPLIDPTTSLPTRFFYRGDPLTGTGWGDSAASDKRMLLTTGPVTIAPGDSQVVIAAIVIGQSSGTLASLANLGCAASYVRQVFGLGLEPLVIPGSPDCPGALAPVISDVGPSSGRTGDVVVISGEGFGATPAENIVRFGGVRATVASAEPGRLTVVVPAGASYAPVSVTTGGGTSTSAMRFLPSFTSLGIVDSTALALPVSLTTASDPLSIAMGDLDGDGRADLVTANFLSNSISVLRNLSSVGSLAFAPRANFANTTPALAVTLGDLDGDGRLDVVATNGSTNLSLFRNTATVGNIAFGTRLTLAADNYQVTPAVADLDGDGRPEIVTAQLNGGTIAVYRNLSTVGNLVFAGRLEVPAGNGPRGLAVGDLDGDGRPDLAASNRSGHNLSLLRNTGRPGTLSFAPQVNLATGSSPDGLAMGDLDGDGRQDLVVCNSGGVTVSFFRNLSVPGSLVFAPREDLTFGASPDHAALGDLDGDRRPDLVTGSRSQANVSAWGNQSSVGDLAFTPFASFANGGAPSGVAVGDLDGDGKPEVAAPNGGSTTLSVFRNTVPEFAIQATAGPHGTITPAGWITVAPGASVDFTISPHPGYRIADVLADSVSVGAVTAYGFSNIDRHHTIEASFAAESLTITATAGANGIIVPAGSVRLAEGGSQTFHFAPNQGSRVQEVLVDGSPVGAVASYTLSGVTVDHTIEARFVLDPALTGTGWVGDGIPVTTATGDQDVHVAAPDGAGGMIIAWRDERSGEGDIYAQRLNSAGVPQWAMNGVPVCAAAGHQDSPTLVADGIGGAIITWEDRRNGGIGNDLYAQRVSAAGVPEWTPDGVVVCAAPDDQTAATIAIDGAGGAIFAWQDRRSGVELNVFVQRISQLGAALWPPNGIPPAPIAADQFTPVIATDGAGGAIVGWSDRRFESHTDIYAQHLSPAGAPDWGAGGVSLCAAASDQALPQIVSDGDSGAIVLWIDARGGSGTEVFAQRVGPNGVTRWGLDGIALAPGSAAPYFAAVSDGVGGAIAAWPDSRLGSDSVDVSAQRLGANGARRWVATGVPLCTATGNQYSPSLASDGRGGAVVAWEDARGAGTDIRAQRVDDLGAPRWAPNGVALCTNALAQFAPLLAADGAGGGLVAWLDARNGGKDIFGQRVGAAGVAGFDHVISATAGANGSIAPSGAVGVFSRSTQRFAITPDPGFRVAGVLVDEIPAGAVTAYDFTDITTDHHISASFSSDSAGPPLSTAGAYLSSSHGFDDPRGDCRPGGWTARNLASRVYAHVADRFLVNDAFMTMGSLALWVGADSTSAPNEVGDWVVPEGFGNGWSQRFTSPAFSRSAQLHTALRFDASIALESAPELLPGIGGNDFVAVQGLRADGAWTFLTGRRLASGQPPVTEPAVGGTGHYKYEVRLWADGNETLPLAELLRLRIVVQTDASGSSEDGRVPSGGGAAVIDNVTLRDSLLDVLPPVDFESGDTGGWTLSAVNGGYSEVQAAIIRDVPPPLTVPQLRTGFDAADPSCVWTFTSAGDSLPNGVYARITSPWVALAAPDSQVLLSFAGKLNTVDQRRVLNVFVRSKATGDPRPRHVSLARRILDAGVAGGDPESPFIGEHVLGLPQDFLDPQGDDSIQVVFQIEDRGEAGGGLAGRLPTRLPFLDELRIHQTLADTDADGVADVVDPCPTVSAAGQDADGDGCVDSTATMRHVESWGIRSYPIAFAITQEGDPTIPDGSDVAAVRAGFQAWEMVPGADVPVLEEAPTPQTEAAALDGVNLVTFTDSDLDSFPPSVLAVTPTTSFTRRTAFGDRVVLPGEIVDADLMFNPGSTFSTPAWPQPGAQDLQSVATHEVGHLFGLGHSGVLDATMFFVIQPGNGAATLTADDASAIAAAYPGPGFSTDFATITGTIRRGRDGQPLPGALVTAVRLNGGGAPVDSVASDYSDEGGHYALRRLPPGGYSVRITPLNKNVGGFPLTPAHVSARLAASAQTDFMAEWWSEPETDRDDPDLRGMIAILAGERRDGIHVVTTVDTLPPSVAAVLPGAGAPDIAIDSPILIRFSEPVFPSTLEKAFTLRRDGQPPSIPGRGELIDGREFVFKPSGLLEFGRSYTIRITPELTDREGLPLAQEFVSTFSTRGRPQLAVTGIHPAAAPVGSIVTISGIGFDPTPGAVNKVLFTVGSGAPDSLDATNVTPTSIVVTVPAAAVTGAVTVVIAGPETGVVPGFTVLLPGPLIAPVLTRSPASLGFAPTDVALSPDGQTAFVVGDGGFGTVDLALPGQPVTVHSTAPARSIALTPDGARAVMTRPDRGEVVVVDAARGSGTLGQPLDTLVLSGSPGGVAIPPDGKRAYVTDALDGAVHVLDIDPASLAPYTERHRIALPATALSGGVAVDPRGGTLYLSSSDRGLLAVDLADDSVVVLNPTPNAGGIAILPSGAEVFAPGGTLNSSLLIASPPDAVSITGQVALGGAPRDVAIHPQGRSALVVNSLLNELQVVDVAAGSPTYHQAVARAATGRSPVAIAVSSGGGVIAVANHGDRTLSVYTTVGADASLRRVVPDAAVAGDLIGVETDNLAYSDGALVDLGDGLFAASHTPGQGVGFVVPASPSTQRVTSLTLQDLVGTRSLALSFAVVDPIDVHAPKLPPLNAGPLPPDCAQSPGASATNAALRLSADGRVLASGRNYSSCPSIVRFLRASAEGAEVFGGFLAETPLGEGEPILDLTFSPDGRRLYVAMAGSGLHVIDSDPASPDFGRELPAPPPTFMSNPTALATDPLGRYILVGDDEGPRWIALFSPSGGVPDTVTISSATTSMAVTGDGRHLVAGMDGQASVIDLSTRNVLATTPLHAGAGTILSVAVVGNGKRAAGLFANSILAVWNLDPLAGPLGAELYFGNPFPPGPTVSQLVPAPDGDGLLAGCQDCDLLFKVEPTVVPPGVEPAGVGQTLARLARSADGRRLWVAERDTTAGMGGLRMLGLGEAMAMDLVSGAGQSARPGEALPLPVQVRLRDASGRPQVGVVVTFVLQGADPGTLDGLAGRTLRRITDVNGQAGVRWTLGGTPGSAGLQVFALGIADSLPVGAEVVATDAGIVPQVVRFGPTDAATDINAGTAVFARFNQRMDPASVTARMSVRLPSGPVPGTFRFEEEGRVAIFQPERALAFSAPCTLRVLAGTTDLDGQGTLADAASAFTTEPPPPVSLQAIGPPAAAAGATVVLEGEGFSPIAAQNVVIFNGKIAPVARAATTSLVTHVPIGAVSGRVRVIVGASTSNELEFEVLVPTPAPGESLATIPAAKAVSDIAITPDGSRAYVTSPPTNSVSVMDIRGARIVTTISVGLQPQGIAILPDGTRAFVANTGSDDLSIIDTDPSSPTYHSVVGRVPVGDGPVELVTSAVGPRVYVANSGSGTVSIIDANPYNGTFNQVVKTVNTGSGTTSIIVLPDATRLYAGTASSVVMVDLGSLVVTTVNTGSGTTSIILTPDATLLLALLDDGQLIVIDAVPGSASFNQVVTTVNTGSGSTSVVVSPDATLAYVTSGDGNSVLVYQIVKLSSGAPVTTLPGAAVTLRLVAVIPVDDGPADIAVDPSHNLFALVANQGSGTITIIGFPSFLPPIPVEFAFSPGSLNLGSNGRWVTGYIEPTPPFLPADIVFASVRLNGLVAADSAAPRVIGDYDDDGRPDLALKFDRAAVQLVLPEGPRVPVRVEGSIGPRTFVGTDSVKVKGGKVTRPQRDEIVSPLEPYWVRWEIPKEVRVSSVALVHSLDQGATWHLDVSQLPNKGLAQWTPPLVVADSVLVAVVEIAASPGDTLVTAVLGVSEFFRLATPTAVEVLPARLEFTPIRPNPSVGTARMRFALPQRGRVDLALYDIQGRRLATLVAGDMDAGWHEVSWDGRIDAGGSVGAGLYFARLRAGGLEFRQRLIWIR